MLQIIILLMWINAGIYDSIQSEIKGDRILKPALMPLLALFYVVSCSTSYEVLLVLALLAGGVGDTFLQKGKEPYMTAGALAFLIGHSIYFPLFLKTGVSVDLASLIILAAYAVYAVMMLHCLLPQIPGRHYKLGAVVYACLICLMSFCAFLRALALHSPAGVMTWIGSCLFVLSDTLIAFRFFYKTKGRGVMETYLAAQFLIVLGYIV